jgi:hypothetical protein
MSIVTQVLCLVVSTVLIFMRCYVRLGFSQPPKSWLLEDCKAYSLNDCFSNTTLGLIMVSFVSKLTRRVALQI